MAAHVQFFDGERHRVLLLGDAPDLGGDGVWVNGTKVQRAALENHDDVQVGGLALEFFED